MAERRAADRRKSQDPGTKGHRRMGDRRDSPRIECELRVRRPGQVRFESFHGDVGLGGARVLLEHAPLGHEVEVGLRIPGLQRELRLLGEVIRVTGGGGRYNAHIRFGELSVKDELALARFLDDASREA